ncbi:Calcium-transporting ATPase [Actinidia chinensis var. chinensis]|uniref:Calcium-transporting ATPase n=1 Tax=Actinidia chinensis var. chinensis TaxID=1590841 RepID=A0A2R6S299_ACTCC|nr:Calcium-transporting ATPase [Actinidia chinensis var. chinensis]
MDMTDRFQQSPYRRQRTDVEAGTGRSSNYGEGSSSCSFEIYRTKDASVHRLRRWRRGTLVSLATGVFCNNANGGGRQR